jgi:hypothetical protein
MCLFFISRLQMIYIVLDSWLTNDLSKKKIKLIFVSDLNIENHIIKKIHTDIILQLKSIVNRKTTTIYCKRAYLDI